MNGAEQKTHTRKTDQLAHGLADTQAAVIERFEEIEARMQQFRERLEDLRKERTHRDQVVDVALDVASQAIASLSEQVRDERHARYARNAERALEALTVSTDRFTLASLVESRNQWRGRTFWRRWRWLVLGW